MIRRFPAAVAALVVAAAPAAAQAGGESATEPLQVADEVNQAFQAMAWEGLAQRLHPDALDYLRLAVDILVRSDTTGYVLDRLLGGTDAAVYPGLPEAEVVRRVMQGVQREVPGLLSSLVSRRTEVLGVVEEGQDRHVVYRVAALVDGAEPRVQVMTLRRAEGRWRVREAEDIRVLHTAIRGIPVPGR